MNYLIKKANLIALSILLISCGENSSTPITSDESSNEETVLTLTSISPTSGAVAGGTNVTLLGQNFSTGINVRFGAADCTNVSVVTSTQLTCVTPANSSGSVSITLTNTDGSSDTVANAFIYGSIPPTFSSVSPSSYINSQSTTLTVSGTGFVSGMTATVGGSNCTSVVVSSASQLTCTSPTGLGAGSYDVVVTSPTAVSVTGASAFSFRVAPTLTILKGSSAQGAFQSCQACHGSQGNLDIANFASLSNSLIAGQPDNSEIWQRMEGIGGDLMPPGGMRPAAERQALADWILDGALNN